MKWCWLVLLLAGCGPKKVNSAEPLVGWHAVGAGQCYHPPAYDGLTTVGRRTARSTALQEIVAQWQGAKGDGVAFDERVVSSVETVLLGEPDKVEQVSIDNLAQCRAAMTSGGDTTAWARWLGEATKRLTEGSCRWRPLDYTLFDYLDIGRGWQINAKVCKGDRVRIAGSSVDYYRVRDGGPWINVAGDEKEPTLGTNLPCNTEGCYAGQLLMRFRSDSGVELIQPVGSGIFFTAPDHGSIEVQINDDTWFDNLFKTEGSIIHHTSIEYKGDL